MYNSAKAVKSGLTSTAPRRIVVAITGATGTIYGVRLLEMLRSADVETHLVISRWGARTLVHETPYSVAQVHALADHVHRVADQGAPISSGSYLTDAMLIVPCSMRTLAAIAHGLGDNLIHRAADVMLKERRTLVLAIRESPLSEIHLRNMLRVTRAGAVVVPPVPSFYDKPQTIDDIVNYTVARLLDHVGIHLDVADRWRGFHEMHER